MDNSIISKLYKYFEENSLYPDEIFSEKDNLLNEDRIIVYITWGDWKHEHKRCDWLMDDMGYELVNVIETETDGSDCYSAERVYKKKEVINCCICGKEIAGYGNNPWPVNNDPSARCCDECNWETVIPARLLNLRRNEKVEAMCDNA